MQAIASSTSSATRASPRVPRTYTRGRKIGSGAAGSAYLATSSKGEEVVVKEVAQGGTEEQTVLKQLRHRHIIAYRDALCLGSKHVIVMEHAAAGDLADWIFDTIQAGAQFSETEVLSREAGGAS